MTDKPLILEHDGKPAYVVVRYEVWRELLEQAEDAEAVRVYDRATAQRDQETCRSRWPMRCSPGSARSGCGANIGA